MQSCNGTRHTSHHETPFLLFLLCVNATATLPATDVFLEFVEFESCGLLSTLTEYMVQSTGDKVQETNTEKCCSLKLIELFTTHTASMLQNESFQISEKVEETKIKISKEALTRNYDDLLV
jgi:hypothetical protein